MIRLPYKPALLAICGVVMVLVIVTGIFLATRQSQSVPMKQEAIPTVASTTSFSQSDIQRLERALGSNERTTQASVMLSDLGKLFIQHPEALPQGVKWQFLPATLLVKDASAYVEAIAPIDSQETVFVVHLDFSSSQWLISGITKK